MGLKRFQGHAKVFSGVSRPVAYYADVARFLGNVKAAIFLCQLVFWRDFGSSPDGWIYKTRQEWIKETALSRNEQENARKLLKKRDYLREERRGFMKQLFYKLNLSKLENDWTEWRKSQYIEKRESGRTLVINKPSSMVTLPPYTESTYREDTRDIGSLNNRLLEKITIRR